MKRSPCVGGGGKTEAEAFRRAVGAFGENVKNQTSEISALFGIGVIGGRNVSALLKRKFSVKHLEPFP